MRRRTRTRSFPLPGVSVGHAAESAHSSGVTALVFDRPTRVVAQVRGPASGTYDVASLEVTSTFGLRDSLFFSGGSLYGLDAARGIRTRLLELGRGAPALGSAWPLPRISGAILFDLPRVVTSLPEYLALGYQAASDVRPGLGGSGRIGAGTGARIAKYAGAASSLPGGIGVAQCPLEGGDRLGVLAVFNSGGALRDPVTGEWIRTARGLRGRAIYPGPVRRTRRRAGTPASTTLLFVVTDRAYDRRDLARLAGYAQDAVARTVIPAGTAFEGDVVFAASTAARSRPEANPMERAGELDSVGFALTELLRQAARAAVAP
ncbi:MAG: P1 family peptidase [Thermoplasmata archaeon]|nr:P1 family peptidase [Thermoplasmata archaeon]